MLLGVAHPRLHGRRRARDGLARAWSSPTMHRTRRGAGASSSARAARTARQDGDADGEHRASTTLAHIAAAGPGEKPLVVADVWDNPGGGVAGDSTRGAARRSLQRGVNKVGVATIWDPRRQRPSASPPARRGDGPALRRQGRHHLAASRSTRRVEVLRTVPKSGWQSFGKSQRAAGRGGGGSPRRHRDRRHPQHQPHADLRARHLHQSRHRFLGRRPCCWSNRPTISSPGSRRSRARCCTPGFRGPIRTISPRVTDYRKLSAADLASRRCVRQRLSGVAATVARQCH